MSELIDLTAAQAAERVRAGETAAAELFDVYRERAAADGLNAYTWVAASAPPGNGQGGTPLGGVPVAVKDLFCTEGVPSQAASKILEGYRPPYTATVVAKLRDAGAPLLGKTNQDEFAMGSSNENSAFGPVLNPWDRGRVPGGSSGGSAAAVAAGLAPWAIGTDTGGSIPPSAPVRSSGTPSLIPLRSSDLGSSISPGKSSEVESWRSRPTMWRNISAASVTSRVSGPAWSSEEANAIIP